MTPEERTNNIERLARSYEALPQWVKNATMHAMGVPRINPKTEQPFSSFKEMLEVASDDSIEILLDDFESNGDLLE